MIQPQIVLASTSVYRRELLSRLQLPFISIAPIADETPLDKELPTETALRLARLKAQSLREQYPNALIIGSDQVAALENQQIGKPITHENAVKQLRAMRGKAVAFHSALCLLNAANGKTQLDLVTSTVWFRYSTDEQIENYLQLEQPYQCAGSAKSEGLGIALIEKIQGDDPNALIGLPLISLITMLNNEGVHLI